MSEREQRLLVKWTSDELKPERHAYLQVAKGSVTLNGKTLETGDGAEISKEQALELTGVREAEVLLFDLA